MASLITRAFRRTPGQDEMPPRPQSPLPGDRPRGAMVTEGPRATEWDPCIGAGPMTVASSKNGET